MAENTPGEIDPDAIVIAARNFQYDMDYLYSEWTTAFEYEALRHAAAEEENQSLVSSYADKCEACENRRDGFWQRGRREGFILIGAARAWGLPDDALRDILQRMHPEELPGVCGVLRDAYNEPSDFAPALSEAKAIGFEAEVRASARAPNRSSAPAPQHSDEISPDAVLELVRRLDAAWRTWGEQATAWSQRAQELRTRELIWRDAECTSIDRKKQEALEIVREVVSQLAEVAAKWGMSRIGITEFLAEKHPDISCLRSREPIGAIQEELRAIKRRAEAGDPPKNSVPTYDPQNPADVVACIETLREWAVYSGDIGGLDDDDDAPAEERRRREAFRDQMKPVAAVCFKAAQIWKIENADQIVSWLTDFGERSFEVYVSHVLEELKARAEVEVFALKHKGQPTAQADTAPVGRGTTWQEAMKVAEAHCGRNPFPGVNALAKIVRQTTGRTCSKSTILKAIDHSTMLRAKQAEHEARRTSVSTVAMSKGTAASAKQTREVDPAEDASTDEIFRALIEQAKDKERASLNAMNAAQRRELVAAMDQDSIDRLFNPRSS